MRLAATIRNVVHRFDTLREVMAKANSKKSGDDLAGISARSAVERVAARAVLANVTLATLRQNPVVPYEIDELTRMFEHTLDEAASRRSRTSRSGSSASGYWRARRTARRSARSRLG